MLRWAAVALAATAVWLISWSLLHHGFLARDQIVDTPVYESYGDAMRGGQVPYRDFRPEYPPAALPAFLAPELTATPGDYASYTHAFDRWMAGCGVAMILFCVAALAALEVPPLRAAAPLGLIAVSPLLLGSLVLTRFDLWPAALAAAAVAALLSRLELAAAVLLGVAIAAKLYPGVLAPLAIAWVWRRRERAEAARWTILLVGVVLAVFLPFAVLSPDGIWYSLRVQAARSLQIESLGAALIVWAHHLFGVGVTVRTDRSQNIVGTGADVVGVVSTLLQVAAVVAAWVLFARGPATSRRLVCAAAAATTAFVAFGKVLSPQFLVWLIPLVPLVRGRVGVVASALLAAALVLTQFWFPHRYWRLPNELDKTVASAVLARDLVLVALTVLLLRALRPAQLEPGSKPT